jgi:bacterioferritin (cytochrome b1)
MTTLVGTQKEFFKALYELCELDYDAAEAYKVAINRLENEHYKKKMSEFLEDHERHVQEIEGLLKNHQHTAPNGPSMKQYLTEGKVLLADSFGDKAILVAMLTNEMDTNTAYQKLNQYADKWEDAIDILREGLKDERKHKLWLETNISK